MQITFRPRCRCKLLATSTKLYDWLQFWIKNGMDNHSASKIGAHLSAAAHLEQTTGSSEVVNGGCVRIIAGREPKRETIRETILCGGSTCTWTPGVSLIISFGQ